MNPKLKENPVVKWIVKKKTLLIVIIIILFLIYQSDTLMFGTSEKVFNKLNQWSTQNNYLGFILKVNSFARIEYKLNPFIFKKDLSDGKLPIYDLRFSQSDMVHFKDVSQEAEQVGYLTENNTWRTAELKYNGRTYKVEARLGGDSLVHRAYRLKSYQIKTTLDKKTNLPELINGMDRFNLFVFEDKLFKTKIGDLISSELKIPFILKGDFVTVKINGITQGLYYLEEGVGSQFLEQNNCVNCQIFSETNNIWQDHPSMLGYVPYGVLLNTLHQSSFDYEISNININEDKGTLNPKAVMLQAGKFLEAVESREDKKVLEFFDADHLSSIEALKALTGSSHFITGDNPKFIYNAKDSKIYITPKIEAVEPLILEKGSFEHTLTMYRGEDSVLSQIFTKDDSIRQLRNKKLYSYISSNGTNLMDSMNQVVDFYYPYAKSYETNQFSPRFLKYSMKKDNEILASNMQLIKESLEYSKCYINAFENQNNLTLEIIPDSMSQLRFTKFDVNLSESYIGEVTLNINDLYHSSFSKSVTISKNTRIVDLTEAMNNLYFSATLDDELYPQKERYRIEIIFLGTDVINIGSINAEMQNDITKKDLPQNDIYIGLASSNVPLTRTLSAPTTEEPYSAINQTKTSENEK